MRLLNRKSATTTATTQMHSSPRCSRSSDWNASLLVRSALAVAVYGSAGVSAFATPRSNANVWSTQALSATSLFPTKLLSSASSPPRQTVRRKPTQLYDINEWRDIMFDLPGQDRRIGVETGSPPREICVLPFSYEEVLLQGQTKQLRLYEDRFIALFEDCMDNHGGVVAMGLLADSGIIQTVPICEVEAYNRVDGFGIFVTIRVVSRASLMELTQQDPYIRAVCTEVVDRIPTSLDLPNLAAANIETYILTLTSMEQKLDRVSSSNGSPRPLTEEEITRVVKPLRELRGLDEDEDEDDDNEGDDDDDDDPMDRRGRFTRAYDVAKATDAQGYMVSSSSSSSNERSVQDLTALSWAAFCSDEDLLQEEASGAGSRTGDEKSEVQMVAKQAAFRLQALDADDLFERLKLATFMLRDKKSELQAKLALAGINHTEGEGEK